MRDSIRTICCPRFKGRESIENVIRKNYNIWHNIVREEEMREKQTLNSMK